MDFRHELKHRVSTADFHLLRTRLRAFMQPDPNGDESGRYVIRSLYFDNAADKALREKIDGLNLREKFRIRFYNGNTAFIRLEKKSKQNSLGQKQSALLTLEEARALIERDWEALRQSPHPLVLELYSKMLSQQLRARTIVEYVREAYHYPPGNVRITFDSQLKTGLFATDVFDPLVPLISPSDPAILLEVKYDAFMPEVVAKLLQLGDRHAAAFSKYTACRAYG